MSGPTPEPAGRPELSELEAVLRDLAPRPAQLDRDAVLFRAGQSAGRRGWFWPAATAISTGTALVLAIALACRPGPAVVERVVYLPAEPPAPVVEEADTSVPPAARSSEGLAPYRRLEDHLFRQGLEGLGEPPPPPDAPPLSSPFSISSGE